MTFPVWIQRIFLKFGLLKLKRRAISSVKAQGDQAREHILRAFTEKHSRIAWRRQSPYLKCLCGSGEKFRFCCWPKKEKSMAWALITAAVRNRAEQTMRGGAVDGRIAAKAP